MASNRAVPDTIRTLLFSSIAATYNPLGTPLAHMARMFRIINATDGDIFFSIDGINDNYFLPAGTFVLYDVTGNSGIDSNFRIATNTQFYARYSSAPTKNSVYLENIYGVGE